MIRPAASHLKASIPTGIIALHGQLVIALDDKLVFVCSFPIVVVPAVDVGTIRPEDAGSIRKTYAASADDPPPSLGERKVHPQAKIAIGRRVEICLWRSSQEQG